MIIAYDTGDPQDVIDAKENHDFQFLKVTTNPSLMRRSHAGTGTNYREVVGDFKSAGVTDVSCETIGSPNYTQEGEDLDTYIQEAMILWGIDNDVVTIKVPATEIGLMATKRIAAEGARVNSTLIFNAQQAELAGDAGAAYASPFWGRLDDYHAKIAKGIEQGIPMNLPETGRQLISNMVAMYAANNAVTNVLAASVRNADQVFDAYTMGVQMVTFSPSTFDAIVETDKLDQLIKAQKAPLLNVPNNPVQLEPLDLSKKLREVRSTAFAHPLLGEGLDKFFRAGEEADVIGMIMSSRQ